MEIRKDWETTNKENKYRQSLENDGYLIIQNFFSKSEIIYFRNLIYKFLQNNKKVNKYIKSGKDRGKWCFGNINKYTELMPLSNIINSSKLIEILDDIFDGKNYRFCQHSEFAFNQHRNWHKDKLNGEYSKYETQDIWKESNGEKQEIIKVGIYLQNHSNNNDSLIVVPKSHLNRKIETQGAIQLKPAIGDIIIFDQRITHRGPVNNFNYDRIMVSFGFGKNNIFTDNFEKGTIERQNHQNKTKCLL